MHTGFFEHGQETGVFFVRKSDHDAFPCRIGFARPARFSLFAARNKVFHSIHFAWRRRSPSVLNVDRYPADDNAIILSFWLSGGRGSDLGLFHKAKLPRGIIGCIRVHDANHCHTDANHCHGQNIAGSRGWNIHGLSVEDMPERKSFFLGSLCLCNYSKINSINGVQPTFSPLTAMVGHIWVCP